jgi:hypothetical protein
MREFGPVRIFSSWSPTKHYGKKSHVNSSFMEGISWSITLHPLSFWLINVLYESAKPCSLRLFERFAGTCGHLNPSVLTICHLHRRSSKLIWIPKVKRLLLLESEHIIIMGLQKEPFRRLPSGLDQCYFIKHLLEVSKVGKSCLLKYID